MPESRSLLIVSDIHYAGPLEKNRAHHEARAIGNPALRCLAKAYRHFIWLRDPFAHNHLLETALDPPIPPDFVIANGDFSCDTAFVGVSDDAAFQSALQCLSQFRQKFGASFYATIGDHELGKLSLFGGKGGMRLESWRRALGGLDLQPFWQFSIGGYRLAGFTSSLIGLPVYLPETLSSEQQEWEALRACHLAQIRQLFAELQPDEKLILFCHDPTALPFLWREPIVQEKAAQIERTVIGHLHTPLILWKSRLLAGLPTISFLGNTARRLSAALGQARDWKPFRLLLCPSLAGCELLKDGGYVTAKITLDSAQPAQFHFHPLPR